MNFTAPGMTLREDTIRQLPLMQSSTCPTCKVYSMHHVLDPKVGDPFFQCLDYTCQAQWPFK
jgi:hypothetical protein